MIAKVKEDSVNTLLAQVCKYRRNKSNALLSESGIHAGQDTFLYHLSLNDGQTVSELVGQVCVQHATIFNMIDRMEASGMIRKEKDSMDKRTSRVYITEKGKEAMCQVAQTWKAMDAMTTKDLSPEQKEQLVDLLQLVLNNLK